MGKGFLPTTDAGLLRWASGFAPQINSSPGALGLSAAQAESYADALAIYSAALQVALSENTRTRGAVAAKNSAKAALRAASMQLAGVVRMHPGITDRQLEDLGLTVPVRSLAPVRPPELAPMVTPLGVVGRTARYRMADASAPSSKRRPPAAQGAVILTYVGDDPPPADRPGWMLHGQVGRTTFLVGFPNDVPPGTACWVIARWYNRRGEYSPASQPVQTYLQVGPLRAAA